MKKRISIEYTRKITYSATVELDEEIADRFLKLDGEIVDIDEDDDAQEMITHCGEEDVTDLDYWMENIRVTELTKEEPN